MSEHLERSTTHTHREEEGKGGKERETGIAEEWQMKTMEIPSLNAIYLIDQR